MQRRTSHFVSRAAAIRYYRAYMPGQRNEAAMSMVDQKLADGEIHIGAPPLKAGESLRLIDNGMRYGIEAP